MQINIQSSKIVTIILLFLASLNPLFAQSINLPNKIKSDLDRIKLHIKANAVVSINKSELRKFLDFLSNNRKITDTYFKWSGSEFGFLIRDLDFDKKDDVVLAYQYDRNNLVVSLFKSKLKWDKPEIKLFKQKNHYTTEKVFIYNHDLNNDGFTDYYIRLVSAGRQYEKSIDCAWIYKNTKNELCTINASSLEEDPGYIRYNSNKINYYVSQVVDLNKDTKFEFIQTELIALDGIATSIYWPNVFSWNGEQYIKSNQSFLKFYKGFSCDITKRYSNFDKSPSFNEIKKRLIKLKAFKVCK